MKKTYIIPQLHITEVRSARLFAASELSVDAGTTVERQYVKENTTDRSNYNVWNDDWSE